MRPLTRREALQFAALSGATCAGRLQAADSTATTVLVVDESSVTQRVDCKFHLNRAVKCSANPVLVPGEPHEWDSLQVSWPATVLWDGGGKRFRCWYSGLDAVQTPDRRWLPGYAESMDGVHWTKPNLGQVNFLDRPTNQILSQPHTILSLVWENPLRNVSENQRFCSYSTERDVKTNTFYKVVAYSADGMRWTRRGAVYQGKPGDRDSFQDICQLVYDPDDPDPSFRIKAYSQIMRPRQYDKGPVVRHIGLAHGADIEHLEDAPDPVVLAPEKGIDEETHFASVRRTGGQFLMLFESDRFSRNPIHGDLRLAVSTDGRKFRRVHPHEALVETGPKGTWDENLLVTTTSAMQEIGDEIYIFYIGCPGLFNSWPYQYAVAPMRRGAMFAPAYMGLAILPLDRYAYAEGPGTIMTQPLTTSGSVWLNADGLPEVSAVEVSGRQVATGHLGTEKLRTVYRRVEWSGSRPSGTIRLRVRLGARERLYSYRST